MNNLELCWSFLNSCLYPTMVDLIRLVAVGIWLYVFRQSFQGVKALLFKTRSEITTADRNDAWVAAVALSIILFNLRWYVNVDSESLFTGLYVFSILIAAARIFTYESDRYASQEGG